MLDEQQAGPTTTGGAVRQPGHDAFLSYSHAADGRLAPALQRGLHQLARPFNRLRALRIFRDQTDLSANPDLWSTIEAALTGSRHFVLLASPDAARSEWVGREVEHWIRNRERESFLVVLTDGEIAWDEESGDFDWERTTALPRALRGWFGSEPLWVDLTWARTDEHLSVRHARFRDAVATIAAPMHGRSKDELDSDDVRRYRRFNRIRNAAVAVIVILGVVAAQQALRAESRADDAQTALERVISRDLAGRSEDLGDTDPAVSKLLSVAAWRIDPSAEARGAMVAALDRPGMGVLEAGNGAFAISADGRVLAVARPDRSVRFYDTASQRQLGAPIDNRAEIYSMKFGSDGRRLVAGDVEGRVRIFDVTTHEQIGDDFVARTDAVVATALSRDGRTLATAGTYGTVQLHDLTTGTQIGTAMPNYTNGNLAFSPDGTTLAFYDGDGVRLWSTTTQQPVGAPMTALGEITAIAFSPDGAMLATSGYDGAIRIWDAATQQLRGEPIGGGFRGGSEGGGASAVAFTEDGSVVSAVGLDGSVRAWNVAEPRRELGAGLTGNETLRGAVYSAGGGTLAVLSENGDGIRLWDINSFAPRGIPVGESAESVLGAEVSPDGRLLATGDVLGQVRVFDLATGQPVAGPFQKADGGQVSRIVFSPDSRRIAFGHDVSTGLDTDPDVEVWDIPGEERVGRSTGTPLSFSADGSTLVAALGNAALDRWDLESDRHYPISTLDDDVQNAGLSRDARLLALSEADGTVSLWDAEKRELLGELRNGPGAHLLELAWSPDDRVLAVGSTDGTVRFWDVTTRTPLGDPLPLDGPVDALRFGPDGDTLAISAGFEIVVWDLPSRRQIGPARSVHGESPTSLSFTPDGRALAANTGATPGHPAARLWALPPRQDLDRALCDRVGRSLSADEWQRYLPDLPHQQVCP